MSDTIMDPRYPQFPEMTEWQTYTDQQLHEICQKAKEFYGALSPQRLKVSRVLGVDVGQIGDPTALALLERVDCIAGFDHVTQTAVKANHLLVRHLERIPLRTPYGKVIERVQQVVAHFDPREKPVVVVDRTGVGAPIVDKLREALVTNVYGMQITGSGIAKRDGDVYNVPKRDLITNLQILLEEKRLQIAGSLAEAGTLVNEMQNMRVKVSPFGHEAFGCWREGQHDDLVLALAMACWWMKQNFGSKL